MRHISTFDRSLIISVSVIAGIGLLMVSSCGKQRGEPHQPAQTTEISTTGPVVKVYLENSQSMHGYVKGNTTFEDAIGVLLVKLKNRYGKESINLHFINKEVIPVNKEIEEFAHWLEPNTITKGDIKSSNLNLVIRLVLENLLSDDIAVLVSDCIYSIKGEDTEGLLSAEKNLTMDAFLTKFKEFKISTMVLRLSSPFRGVYFDKFDHPTSLNGETRPYYIWFIGRAELISEVLATIEPTELAGYENRLVLETEPSSPFYTILETTNRIGTFKIDREQSGKVGTSDYVRGVKDVEPSARPNEKGILQFAVAIDLSPIKTDESYKLERSNYEISRGFDVQSIDHIDSAKLADRDRQRLSSVHVTHILNVRAARIDAPYRELRIGLKQQLPQWVTDANVLDDTHIRNSLDKTFGIKYLMRGVTEAYKTASPGQDTYFTVVLSIKR